jgi:hypothetical protein
MIPEFFFNGRTGTHWDCFSLVILNIFKVKYPEGSLLAEIQGINWLYFCFSFEITLNKHIIIKETKIPNERQMS